MQVTDEQRQAIKALALKHDPYIDLDIVDGVLLDGVLTLVELRALLAILDPPKARLNHGETVFVDTPGDRRYVRVERVRADGSFVGTDGRLYDTSVAVRLAVVRQVGDEMMWCDPLDDKPTTGNTPPDQRG